jgi:adenylate kinase family enzyme
VHVIGNSCSGKSTLGSRLARALGVAFVELDALNWKPDWVALNATNPEEFERRIREATVGEGWVVAGSYSRFCQRVFWPRLQTVIWLDLPLPQLVWRVLRRSWRRWRSKELLWGTNHERFWPQLMLWRKEDSLLWWIISQHARKRQSMLAHFTDPRWSHIRFIRLTSSAEVESFARALEERIALSHPRVAGAVTQGK